MVAQPEGTTQAVSLCSFLDPASGHVDKSLYTAVDVDPAEAFLSFVNTAGGAGRTHRALARCRQRCAPPRRLPTCASGPPRSCRCRRCARRNLQLQGFQGHDEPV